MAFQLMAARWLRADGRGMLSMLLTGKIAALFMGLGMPASIMYCAASDPRTALRLARREMKLLGVMALGLMLLGLVNRWLHWLSLDSSVELVLVLFVLSNIALPAFAALALSLGSVFSYNLAALVPTAGAFVGLIVLRLTDALDATTALGVLTAATFGGALVPLLFLWRATHKALEVTVESSLGSQWRVAMLGFASNGFTVLTFRADIFLVASLAGGVAAAGIYSVGIILAELAVKVPQWAGAVLSPRVASREHGALNQTISLFWLSLILAGIAYLPILVFPSAMKWLLTAILGPDFVGVYPVLVALFPRALAQAGGTILFSNLSGKGYTRYHPLATLAGLIVTVVCDLLLIPRFGLVGAAIGGAVGLIPSNGIAFLGFLRHNGIGVGEFIRRSRAWAAACLRPGWAMRRSLWSLFR